jgi:tetratricopeptide (TPR) repeat protein
MLFLATIILILTDSYSIAWPIKYKDVIKLKPIFFDAQKYRSKTVGGISIFFGFFLQVDSYFRPHFANAIEDNSKVALESSRVVSPIRATGKLVVDGEASRIFLKAQQCENDGDFKFAQQFYEQVIEAEPDFVYAWSNLGNVLTAEGNLHDALLCYKKALSLSPPKQSSAIILLNKASIEVSEGDNTAALRDMEIAESFIGPQPSILTNKAVAFSNLGRWQEACSIFEKVCF